MTIHSFDELPLTEFYIDAFPVDLEKKYDQKIMHCANCDHIFLKHIVSVPSIYGGDYQTESSTKSSTVALQNFSRFIKKNWNLVEEETPIIDIGGNDASLIEMLANSKNRCYVIDPVYRAKRETDHKIKFITKFVEDVNFTEFGKSAKIYISSHTLEHIKHPRGIFETLAKYAVAGDKFFFQFPSAEGLVRNGRWYQVHHQHLHYFSRESFEKLLLEYGFGVQDYNLDETHYGAHQFYFAKGNSSIKRKPSHSLSPTELECSIQRFETSKIAFSELISPIAGDLIGYGAGLMTAIVYYHFPPLKRLRALVDDAHAKWGRQFLNTPHVIESSQKLQVEEYAGIVVTGIVSESAYRSLIGKSLEYINTERYVYPKSKPNLYLPVSII